MSKRKRFWLIFSGASVLLVVLILGGFVLVFNRLLLADMGLASPNFPYGRYSEAELEKLYPENIGEGVATTRSPEETHRLFVEYLKQEDFENAADCCFVKKYRSDMKKALVSIKEDNELAEMIKDLDVELTQNLLLDTHASFLYKSEDSGGSIEFIKDKNGVWLIESL
ncbi:MAG: hypothetical protein Q8O88_01995 [bacterium]|nr:hypothetical protein [bacterium]